MRRKKSSLTAASFDRRITDLKTNKGRDVYFWKEADNSKLFSCGITYFYFDITSLVKRFALCALSI